MQSLAQKFLNHTPDGFPHLTYAEALESVRIDLDFHRRAIVQINKALHRSQNSICGETKLRLQAEKENHKRACGRLESRWRSLLFGGVKR